MSDVRAVTVDDSGEAVGHPTRVKGLVVAYEASGTLELRDGGASGELMFEFTAPASDDVTTISIPGDGIRFRTSVYAAVSDVTATVMYG